LFTVRRIANSWLDGASAGPVDELVTGSGGIVSAEAADGPTRQTNSTAATTLRRGHFSDIRGVGAAGYSFFRIAPVVWNQKLCAVSG